MRNAFGKTIIVALGGSVVYPDGIDVAFLKNFKNFLAPFLKRRVRFVLVVGGGHLARLFQEAAGKTSRLTDDDKDWLGIHATRLNAHLLRTIFRDVADPTIVDSRKKISELRYPITIAAGWRPGWSTDYVAMRLAKDFGLQEVVIAGKPSHVYDKDFVKYKNATPFERISWREYRKLIPQAWKPGFHSPVDPVAAVLGSQKKTKAIVINGKDLNNFSNLLNGKDFKGTIVG